MKLIKQNPFAFLLIPLIIVYFLNVITEEQLGTGFIFLIAMHYLMKFGYLKR